MYLLKHYREKNHQHVWENGCEVLGNNYRSNFKRKISEALFIKQSNKHWKLKRNQFSCNYVIDLIFQRQVPVRSWHEHTTATIVMIKWDYNVRFEHVNAYCYITWMIFPKVYIKRNIWIENYLFGVLLYWLWANRLFLWRL